MPFDDRTTSALAALRSHFAVFRFVVGATLDRATKTVTSESGPSGTGLSLGNFAAGRIDPKRFAMVFTGAPPLDATAYTVIERAVDALTSIRDAGDDQFVVEIAEGGSLSDAIESALTRFGSVFEAGALSELVRRRTYDPLEHGFSLKKRAFRDWTAGERKLAPPLVVRVRGADVDPFALGAFLDGCVRLILIVDEPCAPACLARLISPGVFVAQTSDAKVLEKLNDLEAPAIVAIMNGAEARFVHDPRMGSAMWQRIQVTRMPEASPRKSLGARSAWQQREDLSHLKSLVEPPSLVPRASNVANGLAPNGGAGDPVERLTAWLLDQSRASVS